jgi:hypothetical protein
MIMVGSPYWHSLADVLWSVKLTIRSRSLRKISTSNALLDFASCMAPDTP